MSVYVESCRKSKPQERNSRKEQEEERLKVVEEYLLAQASSFNPVFNRLFPRLFCHNLCSRLLCEGNFSRKYRRIQERTEPQSILLQLLRRLDVWTTFIKEWVKNRKKEAKKNKNLYFFQNINFFSLFLSFVSKLFFRNFNITSSVHRCLLFLDERQEQLVFVTGDKRDNEQVKLKEQQIIINFYLIVHLLLLTLILHQTKLYYLCDPLHSHLFVTQGIIVFVFHFQF